MIRASLLVGLITLLAWAPIVPGDFVYDDFGLLDRPDLADLRRLASAPYWASPSLGQHYRPIPLLSFGLTWHAVGPRPWVFRLTDVLLHAGVASILVMWLIRLGWSALAAGVIGLLWALHPAHVETIASSANRPEMFMAAFSLLAWLAAAARWWTLVVGLSAMAVLSKETAVVLVGLVPLTVLIQPAWPWRRAVVAVGLGLAIAWILRALVLGPIVSPGGLNASRNPLVDAELLGRAIGATTVLRLAGQHLFWPVNLAPDYSPHAVPVGTVHDIVLVGLGLLAIGFWAWRSRGRVAIAISLVILPLLPVSSIVVPIGAFYADRWLYLPAVGAAILVGEIIVRLRRPVGVGIVGTLLVFALIQTWAAIPAWRSNTALAARMVEATPRNGYAHFFQATAAAKEKQWGTVERALRAAWRDVTPGARGRVAFSLGSFIWHRDRERALRWFRLANSYPDVLVVEGYRTFSRVLREAGDVNGAAWAAEQARQLQAVLDSRSGRGPSSLTP